MELFREFFDGIDEEQSVTKSAVNGANFNNLVGEFNYLCLLIIKYVHNFIITNTYIFNLYLLNIY